MAAPSKIVQARHVYKIFKRDQSEVRALEDISLEIPAGEFMALMGPSGSGKTTLLNMIAAIDRPSTGDLDILGESIFNLNDEQVAHWRNTNIGYVFQTFNLIPVLTALENVELPLLLTKLNARQRREHAITALKLVGLEERINHLPKQLSGGQEQRVAIARAIVSDPTLILADEPTGDLDRQSATEIMEILKRLNEDFHKTIIMVTHDPHAASYARVTRYLEKGRLLNPALEQANRAYRSQHGQDKFLDEVVFKGKTSGTFVEIGACDGLFLSNTYFFEKERAWNGICIEPRRSQFDDLRRNRSCICLNLCVSATSGEEQFTEFKGIWMPGLSGLEKNFYPEHRETIAVGLSHQHSAEKYEVKTDTLTNILKANQLGKVDYCSIDVEGSEMEVLSSIDFNTVHIDVFSIENNYSNPEITNFMQKQGYTLVQEIGQPMDSLDQIYVKSALSR
jgi:putative ABC transport system ATP-binding protein